MIICKCIILNSLCFQHYKNSPLHNGYTLVFVHNMAAPQKIIQQKPLSTNCDMDITLPHDTVVNAIVYKQTMYAAKEKQIWVRSKETALVPLKFDSSLIEARDNAIATICPDTGSVIVLRYMEGDDYETAKKSIHDADYAFNEDPYAYLTLYKLDVLLKGTGFLVVLIYAPSTAYILDVSDDQYENGYMLPVVLYWLHGGAPPYRGYHKGSYILLMVDTYSMDRARLVLEDFVKHHTTGHKAGDLLYSVAATTSCEAPDRLPQCTVPLTDAVLEQMRHITTKRDVHGFVCATINYLGEDIGTFTTTHNAGSHSFDSTLEDPMATGATLWTTDVPRTQRGATEDIFTDDVRVISDEDCAEMMELARTCVCIRDKQEYQHDCKIPLDLDCIPSVAQMAIVRLLNGVLPTKVQMRYTRPSSEDTEKCAWIPFHTDVAKRTVQIPLTGDDKDDVVGGRFVFVHPETGVVTRMPRHKCVPIVHNGTVVHGVSRHTHGVRCALFASVEYE